MFCVDIIKKHKQPELKEKIVVKYIDRPIVVEKIIEKIVIDRKKVDSDYLVKS